MRFVIKLHGAEAPILKPVVDHQTTLACQLHVSPHSARGTSTLHVSRLARGVTWRLAVLVAEVGSFAKLGAGRRGKAFHETLSFFSCGLQGSFAPMVVKWSKGKPTPVTPVAGANKRKGGPEHADQTNTQVRSRLGRCAAVRLLAARCCASWTPCCLQCLEETGALSAPAQQVHEDTWCTTQSQACWQS